MKANTTVSIVMCTYNGEPFIREQLDSILSQTYPIYELIIQDDCSTDNTPAIIEAYAAQYPCIQLYHNKQNLGFNRNFKEAIRKATGAFIAISDQDDVWLPHKLARQVEAIGPYDLCFSSYWRGNTWSKETPVVTPQYNIERLLFTNCIPGHSMLIRRSLIQLPHSWNEHICYDWWFLICAHLNKGVIRVDEPLNWHRSHADSAIATLHRQHVARVVQKPTYHPYLYGLAHLYRLKKKKAWNSFYAFFYQQSLANTSLALPNKLCRLSLQKSPIALFRLCLLCLKHRKQIYPNPNVKGIPGYVRSFFYPLINAYNNTNFEL